MKFELSEQLDSVQLYFPYTCVFGQNKQTMMKLEREEDVQNKDIHYWLPGIFNKQMDDPISQHSPECRKHGKNNQNLACI
jgi:hypothetical protein